MYGANTQLAKYTYLNVVLFVSIKAPLNFTQNQSIFNLSTRIPKTYAGYGGTSDVIHFPSAVSIECFRCAVSRYCPILREYQPFFATVRSLNADIDVDQLVDGNVNFKVSFVCKAFTVFLIILLSKKCI